MKSPIPYSDNVEQTAPDPSEERALQEGMMAQLRHIITTVAHDYEEAYRGLNAKSHALLEGSFTVHENLPPEFAQGLFAQPATYPALVRLSSISGDPICDAVSVPKGLAIKVQNVPGPLLPDNNGVAVQDFLFANGLTFCAPSLREALALLTKFARRTDRYLFAKIVVSRFLRRFTYVLSHPLMKPFSGLANLEKLALYGGYPAINPLGTRFGSQAPIRFGAYMAKLDVVPESENFKKFQRDWIKIDYDPDAIRHHLWKIFQQEGGSWTLRAQLCRDLVENPIEDASKPWPEDHNPYLPIASLTVKPQNSWSMERAEIMEEQLAYSPWHGLEAHRPLGEVMRARRKLYPYSASLRARLNHCPMRVR